jgi:hypothetical protein
MLSSENPFFVVPALLIKAKQQHGINQNKKTGFL